jgi:predicted nuclease with TOPRIM domain
MMLASDGDYKLRTFHDDSGKEIPHFPTTTRSFWFLDCATVRGLLDDMRIVYRHCETEDDCLRELGMHIGVHPDSNPQQKTIDKKIDKLQEHVTGLQGEVTRLQGEVTGLKGEVTTLNANMDKLLRHFKISNE